MKIKSILFLQLLHTAISFAQVSTEILGELPTEAWETSGLVYDDGYLITHNDSGNERVLFVIDTTTLEVARRVLVTNANNRDWEDMAQDETYFYIGDIGNNRGIRKDLSVLRVSKDDFYTTDRVEAEFINYRYEDQSNFIDNGNSDWDAEALFVYEDQLIILTKQWKSNGTVAYSIPKDPGNYTAQRRDSFDVQGLVTGATFHKESNTLAVIGYSNILIPFIARVTQVKAESIFGGNIVQGDLDIGSSQVEGIAFLNAYSFFFSSENYRNNTLSVHLRSRLFKGEFDETHGNGGGEPNVENPSGTILNPSEGRTEPVIIYGENNGRTLKISLREDINVGAIKIFDYGGRLVLELPKPVEPIFDLDVSGFSSGIYFVAVQSVNNLISKPFIIN